MKKIQILILIAFVGTSAFAQNTLDQKKQELAAAEAKLDNAKSVVEGLKAEVNALKPPVIWKKGGFTALNFNSLGLTNWAAGGVNSNAVTAYGNLFAKYKKDNVSWSNNLDVAYGLIQNKGQDIRKNEDKIDFLTKVGLKATEKLNYAALLNFRSQFAPGFDFSDPTIADSARNPISNFLAPASIIASLGFDYVFSDAFSIYASPATGKFTVVNDAEIAGQWIYIPEIEDPENPGTNFYDSNFRAEFGALLNATFTKDLTERIGLNSNLGLFINYTDVNKANRKNVDVDWQASLNMKLTDYLSASIFTHLLYDNDVAITLYEDDGTTVKGTGPRIQFKRLLGVGFSYKF